MKLGHPSTIGVALLAMGFGNVAFAADDSSDLRPTFSGLYSHVFEDSARGSENGNGGAIAGTWHLSPSWAVELGVSLHSFSESPDRQGTDRQWRERGASIDAQYYLSRAARFSPYLTLGAGGMRLEDRLAGTTSTDPFAQVGAGFRSLLAPHFGIRADALYRYIDVSDRHSVDRSGFREPVLRLGFFIPIGDLPAAATPPPAPEPVAVPVAVLPLIPTPPPAVEVLFEFDDAVFFEFDSARIRPESESRLREAAALINGDLSLKRVEVAGHTCDIGTPAYNQGLSERRARAVHDFLLNEGQVEASRLSMKGYGQHYPKVPNSSAENRKLNRRVQLLAAERQ